MSTEAVIGDYTRLTQQNRPRWQTTKYSGSEACVFVGWLVGCLVRESLQLCETVNQTGGAHVIAVIAVCVVRCVYHFTKQELKSTLWSSSSDCWMAHSPVSKLFFFTACHMSIRHAFLRSATRVTAYHSATTARVSLCCMANGLATRGTNYNNQIA